MTWPHVILVHYGWLTTWKNVIYQFLIEDLRSQHSFNGLRPAIYDFRCYLDVTYIAYFGYGRVLGVRTTETVTWSSPMCLHNSWDDNFRVSVHAMNAEETNCLLHQVYTLLWFMGPGFTVSFPLSCDSVSWTDVPTEAEILSAVHRWGKNPRC